MSDHRSEPQKHPAFGVLTISRVSGTSNLFAVDHPQHHFLRFELRHAALFRDLSRDWIHPTEVIAEFSMSEVQFARFVASAGAAEGVPCTLRHYPSGPLIRAEMPERAETKTEQFSNEIRERGKDAVKGLREALCAARKMAGGGSLKKADLNGLIGVLERAEQQIERNLSFVVEQAERSVEKSVESAKAEIDAYASHVFREAGRTSVLEAAPERKRIVQR